jgi:predicted dehydrogenase
MPRIRTAVVGVGHLGSLHARIYSSLPDCELAGVFDTDKARASAVASKHGVRAFASLDELASAAQAVSLAVPTDQHHSLGRRLLDRGLHLLVEKPVTETAAQAADLVDLARSRGLVLQVGHVERFNPALLAAGERIRDARFVESLRLAPFNPRGTEVPVVLDLMIHDIDIVLSLIGRPVLEVSASGIPVLTGKLDIANARLVFEGGAVANITASRVSLEKVRKMRFFALDRYVSVDMLHMSGYCYRKQPSLTLPLDRSLAGAGPLPDMSELIQREELAPDTGREPLRLELEDFLRCVRDGSRPVVSGEDGLRALEVAGRILNAIDNSLRLAGINL